MKSNVAMSAIGAIILAAGKGKRMNAKKQNKVTFSLANKPIISHIVEFMQKMNIKTIVIVVGHAKKSVMDTLKSYDVVYAEQKKRLGTGHALFCGIKMLPENITNVFVVYGDDAVFYNQKNTPFIKQLFTLHNEKHAAITFLTIEKENPFGLGRIVRDNYSSVSAIVEEKDASEEERKIKEINPGCFLFSVSFLKKYLPKIEKSKITGEYYINSLIDLAIKNHEKIETVQGGKLVWRGVNTPDELLEAEQLFSHVS